VPAFTYTVTTGAGDTETAQVDVAVTAAADIVADTAATGEDSPVTLDVLANDGFAPGAVISAINGSPITDGGSPVAVPNGTVELAGGKLLFTPAPDFNGPVPAFTYTVTTGAGNSETAAVNISVIPTNNPPIASDDIVPVIEDIPVTGTVLNNDSDADRDSLIITAATVDINGDGESESLALGTATPLVDNRGNSIGELTFNHDGSFTFVPALNYNGPVPAVEYTVSDGKGSIDTGKLSLGPVSPVLDPIDDEVTAEIDKPIVIDILANDPVVDPHTIQIVGTHNPGDPLVVSGEGTWTVDPDNGLLIFTPLPTFHAAPSPIRYTVINANGEVSAAALVKIDVQPVVVNDIVVGTSSDIPVTVNVLANDKGSDPATVQIVGTPKSGDPLVVPGEGTWTVDKATGKITFTPLSTFHLDPTPVQYTVKSPSGLVSERATVTVNITPEIGSLIMLTNPEPPYFTWVPRPLPFTALPVRPLVPMWEHDWFKPIDLSLGDSKATCELYLTGTLKNQLVLEREPYHFSIPAGTFRHTDPNEQLEYNAIYPDGSPLPDWLKFDKKTLTFFGVPPKGAISAEVMVTVRDECGHEVHATFFVKVNKEHYRHSSHDKQQSLTKGKPGFSKQLHTTGKMGRLQNGRELLDTLRAEHDRENETIPKSQKG
jgi:CshA-type fibril repeat protein